MSIYKIITICAFLTLIAVCHVHQQMEIIKAGYALQDNKKNIARLVDQNSQLMYNLSRLESPKYLLAAFDDEKIEFASQRIELKSSYALNCIGAKKVNLLEGMIGHIFDLFATSAEAKTHN